MAEIRKFHLQVGEEAAVKMGYFFGGPNYRIVYAGMPAAEVYSLVIASTHGYNSWAHNLYNPVSQKTIKTCKGTLEVTRVTPESILFNFIG